MPDQYRLRRGQDMLLEHGYEDDNILCIGDLLRDCKFPASVRYATGVSIISWPTLVEKLSRGLCAGTIFSATTSTNFDCVDISQLLYRSDFKGKYRVVAPDIPNPDLVRREIAAMCPGLDFGIACTPPPWVIRLC